MSSFDTIWNDIYETGHVNRYPWDAVVSFVFRNAPKDRARDEIVIMEVGCGGANNLWFCAREGFQTIGVDASPEALNLARKRFAEDQLAGEFLEQDFTNLSLEDNSVDLVIDRAALTCTPYSVMCKTINEIHRVLKPGGKFLFIPYGDSHSSAASGHLDTKEKMVKGINRGTLVDVGQITFLSVNDIKTLFSKGWTLEQLERAENTDLLTPEFGLHSEYRVIAKKEV